MLADKGRFMKINFNPLEDHLTHLHSQNSDLINST